MPATYRLAVTISLLLLSISVSIPVFSQSEAATITGRVADPSGAAVVGAKISAINIATNVTSSTQTNGSGFYNLPGLPPGKYRLLVEKEGFAQIVKPDVQLYVQDNAGINFSLQVGSVLQSVTVEAGAPLVNTTDAAVSTVVDRQFAENLPLNGRSFQSLIDLTPGVVVTPTTGYEPGQFSVNGQRTNSNYWMVDGVAANLGVPGAGTSGGAGMSGSVGSYSAFGGTNSLVSVDAMQEFRVQTSTYAPEFGRTPGAQISIVTLSGTNQFHGALFDFFRNEALDANDWFADNFHLPKAAERQNDFGGTFGGPLLKNRTFFFFSYEGFRLKLPQIAQTTVPCDATCTVSGNVRAAAQPVMQPYLNAFPLPNGPEVPSATGTAEFNSSYANSASLDAYSLRLDHKLKDKLSLFARYNYSPSNLIIRGGTNFYSPPLSDVTPAKIRLQTATTGLTWMLSPTASNDFRFNYSRVSTNSYSYLDKFGGAVPPSSYPFPSPYTVNDSSFNIGIYTLINYSLGVGKNSGDLQRQLNFVNGFSWSRGAHNLKFGIDYRKLSPITSAATYGQADFFNDMPSTLSAPPQISGGYAVTASNSAALLFQNLGVYAQDTWRGSSRLTLTYGLRWDIDFTPTAMNGLQLASVTGYSTTDLSNLALAQAGTPLYANDYSNLAPRIGVAYELTRTPRWQSVIRGGFGVFYDLSSSEVGNVLGQGYPFISYNFGAGGNFPLDPTDAAPLPIVPPNATNFGTLAAFDPHLRAPRTLQWNFSVEQALGEQQALTVSYIGAHGSRLIESGYIFNPNPNYFSAILTGNTASSNYNALQAQFKRRLSHGLQALVSYTWSHSRDDASSGFGNYADGFAGGFSTEGPSDFDIHHTLSAALTYDVPAGRFHGFAKRILAGWSTENIIQAHSAPPVDVVDGLVPPELPKGYFLNIRPDVVPGESFYLAGSGCSILFNSQCPGGRGFNPAAFVNPPTDPATGLPLREGNLGRNALRAFRMAQWDFALHRDFPIHEAIRLQFRAEMFNLLNHPNFGPEQGALGAPNFGVSTQTLGNSLSGGTVGSGGLSPLYQTGGPRSIQLALKLTF